MQSEVPWQGPWLLIPTWQSGSEPGYSRPHRDERLLSVLLFQGAQLRRGQQGQSQLSNHWSRHLGHRSLQHRLWKRTLSPGGATACALQSACRVPAASAASPSPPPGPTHGAHARPVSGCLDQLRLVHAELVTA